MKLFYSPFHTFVHKVLVTAHECGHWTSMERIATFPFKNNEGEDCGDDYDISILNPLDTVPTLATERGQVIFGSQAICEYLDAHSIARRMYPRDETARWDALTRMAMSDTIFEKTVQMVAEQWQEPEQWNMTVFERAWVKFDKALDSLDQQAMRGWNDFDIGHAAMLHAISYLGFRAEFYEAKDPLYPNYNWREGRPNLSAWYDEAMQRPSVQAFYMKDFEGDKSAEKCQRAVQDVLRLQRENAE